MAVKKNDDIEKTVAAEDAHAEENASAPVAPVTEKPVAVKQTKADDTKFCVYLGPTIHGVVQEGTVYQGNRKAVEAVLSAAIEKYPLIAKLIVTDKTIAVDRIKVKTAGNVLNMSYVKLASGKSI